LAAFSALVVYVLGIRKNILEKFCKEVSKSSIIMIWIFILVVLITFCSNCRYVNASVKSLPSLKTDLCFLNPQPDTSFCTARSRICG